MQQDQIHFLNIVGKLMPKSKDHTLTRLSIFVIETTKI